MPLQDGPFLEVLRGDTNTLGRTEEVSSHILDHPDELQELQDLFLQDDEWVRLRAASASKRVWRADAELFTPFIPFWFDTVSKLNQASSQWTFAQMCIDLRTRLSSEQKSSAINKIDTFLSNSDDWIVQNMSLKALGEWAVKDRDDEAAKVLIPHLKRLEKSPKKSVAAKSKKLIAALAK